ncbi:MAG: AbrB/MazE/SpoVT family DNA-binding domain-containing protein [Candidatus Lokiarchaeota archaeon]|nr:AbrB/MazE/SpoVT family DNA-binding domain-containing protein [Candidatus Lokiarchaeota archaeon]
MTKVIKATSKGQITLPNQIRQQLGIDQNSYIAVDVIGDYVLMKKVNVKLTEISKLFQEEAKRRNISKKEIEEAILESRTEVWSDE